MNAFRALDRSARLNAPKTVNGFAKEKRRFEGKYGWSGR